MVVEVVTESLNVRDDIWHTLGRQVSREQNLTQSAPRPRGIERGRALLTERHVANFAITGVLHPWHALQFQGRVGTE